MAKKSQVKHVLKKGFVADLVEELKKVSWPSRNETMRLTGVVLGVSLIIGVYIGIIDGLLLMILGRVLGI